MVLVKDMTANGRIFGWNFQICHLIFGNTSLKRLLGVLRACTFLGAFPFCIQKTLIPTFSNNIFTLYSLEVIPSKKAKIWSRVFNGFLFLQSFGCFIYSMVVEGTVIKKFSHVSIFTSRTMLLIQVFGLMFVVAYFSYKCENLASTIRKIPILPNIHVDSFMKGYENAINISVWLIFITVFIYGIMTTVQMIRLTYDNDSSSSEITLIVIYSYMTFSFFLIVFFMIGVLVGVAIFISAHINRLTELVEILTSSNQKSS